MHGSSGTARRRGGRERARLAAGASTSRAEHPEAGTRGGTCVPLLRPDPPRCRRARAGPSRGARHRDARAPTPPYPTRRGARRLAGGARTRSRRSGRARRPRAAPRRRRRDRSERSARRAARSDGRPRGERLPWHRAEECILHVHPHPPDRARARRSTRATHRSRSARRRLAGRSRRARRRARRRGRGRSQATPRAARRQQSSRSRG